MPAQCYHKEREPCKDSRRGACQECHDLHADRRRMNRESYHRCKKDGINFRMIVNTSNWRAAARGAEATLTPEQLEEVWKDQGNKCLLCGTHEDVTFDHIIPILDGGASSVDNMQLLCNHCNVRKGPFGIDFRYNPPRIVNNPIGAVMEWEGLTMATDKLSGIGNEGSSVTSHN